MMTEARRVHVERRVARYLRAVVAATRDHDDIALGVSPRGTLGFFRASQARALLAGRDHVTPDDVQALAVPVLGHRLQVTERTRYAGRGAAAVLAQVLEAVPVPT
jgi:MoxR-like ATPase